MGASTQLGSHRTVPGQHHPQTAHLADTELTAADTELTAMLILGSLGFQDSPDAGGRVQARSAEAGNVRMRLEKAERAIEAERASVRELQRQLAAARQATPAPSIPVSTLAAALYPIPAALQRFRLHELARRLACLRPLLLAERSSCLHHCGAKAPQSLCLALCVVMPLAGACCARYAPPCCYHLSQVPPCSALARRLLASVARVAPQGHP